MFTPDASALRDLPDEAERHLSNTPLVGLEEYRALPTQSIRGQQLWLEVWRGTTWVSSQPGRFTARWNVGGANLPKVRSEHGHPDNYVI